MSPWKIWCDDACAPTNPGPNEYVGSSRGKIVSAALFGFVAGAALGGVVGAHLSLNEPVFVRAVDHKAYYPQEEVARHAIAGNLALNEELEKAEMKANRQIADERQKLAEEELR